MNTNQFTSYAAMVQAAQSIEPRSPMHLEIIEHLRDNPERGWTAVRVAAITDPELLGRLYLSTVARVSTDKLVAPDWADPELSSVEEQTGGENLPVGEWVRNVHQDEHVTISRIREDVYDVDADEVRVGDESVLMWLTGEGVEVDAAALRRIAASLLNAADEIDKFSA
ncbi:hypothetical protein [Microcella alkalica]|uniref:hypothetical protein n=1 Tax=Microcella alkalica TaxID=355930 RepID=UPI00145D2C2E|nr:hypothetical protein [Microcella alkalica]